jgi:hypothetical protein
MSSAVVALFFDGPLLGLEIQNASLSVHFNR